MASGLARHLRNPGDEGYRTPTIEDAERELSIHSCDATANALFKPPSRKARDVHTSALEALHDPAYRGSRNAAVNDSDVTADPGPAGSQRRGSDSTAVDLSWKKRLRHFTWAYFTLTMATGGVANVLYSSGYCAPDLRPS